MKSVKRRIEKLEEEILPEEYEEIKIINHIPGMLMEKNGKELTIRVPKKKRKR